MVVITLTIDDILDEMIYKILLLPISYGAKITLRTISALFYHSDI